MTPPSILQKNPRSSPNLSKNLLDFIIEINYGSSYRGGQLSRT